MFSILATLNLQSYTSALDLTFKLMEDQSIRSRPLSEHHIFLPYFIQYSIQCKQKSIKNNTDNLQHKLMK